MVVRDGFAATWLKLDVVQERAARQRDQLVAEEHAAGASLAELAEVLAVSRTMVRKIIERSKK